MDQTYLGKVIDFTSPPGEAALLPPDSLQWRIYKNQFALGIGGIAAVLLEFAEPRIRSGVWDHSVYKQDPIGRAQRTGLVAMLACYGPASRAREVIGAVNRLHGKVTGMTPNGEKYRALDPELLDWVAATSVYGFLTAYHRFVAPLSEAEQNRFMRDSKAIGSLFGARHTLQSMADFDAMLHRLAPRFEPHPIIFEFLAIIQSGQADPKIPRFLHRTVARAAVSLLPDWLRERLELGREFDLTMLDRFLIKRMGRAADRRLAADAPARQASVRLGLPGDFVLRSPAEQQRLLNRL